MLTFKSAVSYNRKEYPHPLIALPTVISFSCIYRLKRTDDVDECLTNPCENIKTCKNTAGGFECECPAEMNGGNCEG